MKEKLLELGFIDTTKIWGVDQVADEVYDFEKEDKTFRVFLSFGKWCIAEFDKEGYVQNQMTDVTIKDIKEWALY